MTLHLDPDTRQRSDLDKLDDAAWLDNAADEDDAEFGADPMTILERREIERGSNCFDQPIN